MTKREQVENIIQQVIVATKDRIERNQDIFADVAYYTDAILALFTTVEVKEECTDRTRCRTSECPALNGVCDLQTGMATRRILVTSEQAQGMYDLLNAMRPELHARWRYRIDNALSFLTGK